MRRAELASEIPAQRVDLGATCASRPARKRRQSEQHESGSSCRAGIEHGAVIAPAVAQSRAAIGLLALVNKSPPSRDLAPCGTTDSRPWRSSRSAGLHEHPARRQAVGAASYQPVDKAAGRMAQPSVDHRATNVV